MSNAAEIIKKLEELKREIIEANKNKSVNESLIASDFEALHMKEDELIHTFIEGIYNFSFSPYEKTKIAKLILNIKSISYGRRFA